MGLPEMIDDERHIPPARAFASPTSKRVRVGFVIENPAELSLEASSSLKPCRNG
jgi:hypothetical protein